MDRFSVSLEGFYRVLEEQQNSLHAAGGHIDVNVQ